jgi:hypothetical protein
MLAKTMFATDNDNDHKCNIGSNKGSEMCCHHTHHVRPTGFLRHRSALLVTEAP